MVLLRLQKRAMFKCLSGSKVYNVRQYLRFSFKNDICLYLFFIYLSICIHIFALT